MAKLFANNGDPDQMPRSAASDLGLHCFLSTLLRVYRLQWVRGRGRFSAIVFLKETFCDFPTQHVPSEK